MKGILVIGLVLVTFLVAVEAVKHPDWQRFKKTNNKVFKNPDKEVRRYKNWKANRTVIAQHNTKVGRNAGQVHYKMKETPLTDYGWEELKQIALTTPPDDLLTRSFPEIKAINVDIRTIPSFVDYRNSPCLPAVKHQGLCGCCWAFSATTPIEYQQCIKNNDTNALSLSEQQLLDCSAAFGTKGCAGGWYEKAWRYMISSNVGQMSNVSYPYIAKTANGTCKYNVKNVQSQIVSYSPVGQWNETALKIAVATQGPISAAVCATCPTFYNYGSGIYEDMSCNCSVNHGVVIVGYGTSLGTDYWIVRNSWGKNWGLAGYILMRRGVNQNNIAFWPSYPTIK